GAAQAGACALRRRQRREVLAIQADTAGRRPDLARDQIEVGRLARAVGADDGGQRAGRKRARHRIDRHVPTEADREVLGFEHADFLGRSAAVDGRPGRAAKAPRPAGTPHRPGAGAAAHQRLFMIGMLISSGLISRTSSGMAHATFGSTLILKWYMLCMAWWSSLRK